MKRESQSVLLEEFNKPFRVKAFEVPEVKKGCALIKVEFGGICGTDTHLQQGKLPIPLPIILGHEAVGIIAELGEGVTQDASGNPIAPGDRVIWASSIPCGQCYWCKIVGERNLCATRKVYGINQAADKWPYISGSWGEYAYLQEGSCIIKVPKGISGEDVIALGCAGPTAVHGVVYKTKVTMGDIVIVQGAGPVGLAAAIYARMCGAGKIIMVGGPANRLKVAADMGIADVTLDIFEVTDQAERIKRVLAETTDNRGAEVCLECTGSPAAVPEGFEMVRRKGYCLVLGQYTDKGPIPINPHVITKKELTVTGSWARSEVHDLKYVESLPEIKKRIDLGSLVTAFAKEDINEAIESVRAGKVIKAALKF
jgi:threonine dehydrogenase-like Zn-dependent dehydrogenase